MICARCGKPLEGEGMLFCPYCGEKLAAREAASPEAPNAEAQQWIQKALAVSSYPERKKILQQGLAACPGDREIEWEMLFVGEPQKRRRAMDFSIIKCWILDIYHRPKDFSEEEADRMRAQLFDAPELARQLERYADPGSRLQEYLSRLCREYLDIFLEGSNSVMGNWFGFQIGSNRDKKLAAPVAQMIERIRTDEKLSPERREQLWKTLYQAYAAKADGKTGYLDQCLTKDA